MNDNPSNFRPNGSHSGSQQYMDASIRTASPAKLRLMLLERSVEVARLLSESWASGQKKGPNEHSLTLLELISELLSGVAGGSNDAENKLCLQVADLYVFLLQHLVLAEEESDASAIDEIRMVLEAEVETWRAAVAQQSSGQQSSGPAASATAVSATSASATSSSPAVSGGLNFSA